MNMLQKTFPINEDPLRRYAVVIMLAMVVVVSRLLTILSNILYEPFGLDLAPFRGVLYFVTFGIWGYYRSRSVVYPVTRRLLTLIVFLIMFWMAARTIKFELVTDTTLLRYLWYSYYLPICLIPACSFLALASTDRNRWKRFGPLSIALIVLAFGMFLLVFTNDFHELVFNFTQRNPWNNNSYEYGPLWYVVITFVVLLIIASIALISYRSSVPESKTFLLLPLLPLVVGFTYALCYPFLSGSDMTSFFCVLILLEFETLIISGLLHVNQGYRELFKHTSLCAAITNNQGSVAFATNNARPWLKDPSKYEEQPASSRELSKPFKPLEEGLLVRTIPIKNGSFNWVEDNREELVKRRELEERKNELTSLQELLRKQIALEEEQELVAVRSRLYDRLSQELTDEFARIALLTEDRPAYEDSTLQTLATLTVIGAYIKRRSNLIILKEQKIVSSPNELYFCLKESCGCLTECGIPSSVIKRSTIDNPLIDNANTFPETPSKPSPSNTTPLSQYAACDEHTEKNPNSYSTSNNNMDILHVEALYDLFENIVEYLLPTLKALLVHLETTESKVHLLMQVEASFDSQVKMVLDKDPALPLSLWGNAAVYRTLESCGGSISSSFEEKTWNLRVSIPRFHEGGTS